MHSSADSRISLCIPTFNQAIYLEKAILSGIHQTLTPFEIIVYDDCSTDDTMHILASLKREIDILKVYRQKINVGIARNVDACLRAANGEFIIRLDSDDYLHHDYIRKLSELLLKHPDAGYAHAAVQEIDQNGKFLNTRKLFRKSGYQYANDALKASVTGYRVAANIIMFRRSALMNVNFIASRIDFGEDYYLSASLADKGYGNVYLNEILSYYRVWVDTKKIRQRRKLSEIIGFRKIFDDVLIPAYQQRGWNLKDLQKKRIVFACIHADCLASNVYTREEKLELMKELNKLSESRKARLYAWLYLMGLGGGLTLILKIKLITKSILKAALRNPLRPGVHN